LSFSIRISILEFRILRLVSYQLLTIDHRLSHKQGLGAGVGRGLGVGVHLPVHGVGVGVGEAACAQYLPPVFKRTEPPHTIISLPLHTAGADRGLGALVVLVAAQLSVFGLYLPPVLKSLDASAPPHTIISLSVQTAGQYRADGALVVLVAVQLFVPGLYLPPVFKKLLPS
jgi:hypothetical protein